MGNRTCITVVHYFSEVACQTALSIKDIEGLEQECKSRNSEVLALRAQVHRLSTTEEGFERNDEKVNFYTGVVNFVALCALFTLVRKYVKHTE